jgi:c-di-AMP phosphodiesterase-like protein
MNKVFVSESEGLDMLKGNTLVVVCDVHKTSMVLAPKIIEKANKVMIIDHHRRGEDFIESPIFSDIDSSASSACEMIAELIKYASSNPRVKIPAAYATVMLSGIFMDSNFFKSTTSGARTFEACMFLKECGADNAKADDFLKDEFEEHALVNKILANTKTPYYGIVYCMAEDEDIIEPATLAKVGNACMSMKGINASFVIGKTATDEVRISCRSDGTINVQLLAEKMSGGGHFTQAACSFKHYSLEAAETRLLNVLNDYLNDARVVKKGAE